MNLLYENRLRPISDTIGFIAAPVKTVADAYVSWMTPIQAKRQVTLRKEFVFGPLDRLLGRLLPLTSVERRRFLFVPTKSRWTAYFDNGHQGTDSFSVLSFLAKSLGVQGMGVSASLADKPGVGASNEFDSLGFEIYEPTNTDFLNFGRTLSLEDDDGKLTFVDRGTPFPFEQTSRYSVKNLRERLTLELLSEYLRHLEIDAFDPGFYASTAESPAVLVVKEGPTAPRLAEYSLQQVQNRR
jgi:hypothetical protein